MLRRALVTPRCCCWSAGLSSRLLSTEPAELPDGVPASPSPLCGLARLRRELNTRILGQTALKDALVLGLVAKEHVYVEGPPGAAKTLLAESCERSLASTPHSPR